MGRSFLELFKGLFRVASKMLSKSDAKAAPKMGITSSKTVGFTTAGSETPRSAGGGCPKRRASGGGNTGALVGCHG